MKACEVSKKCQSVDLVRKSRHIDHDNIKSKKEIPNFSALKQELKGKHLRIRSVHNWFGPAGFYTYPMYVMNQIRLAKQWGLIGDKKPFVYMPETNHYFTSCQDGGESDDFWLTYFDPVDGITGEGIPEQNTWEFSQATLESLHHNKDMVHSYPYKMDGALLFGDVGTKDWMQCHRNRAQKLVDNYIHVKPQFIKAARELYQTYKAGSPNTKIQGVHVRGTDKWINAKVPPEAYQDNVKRFLASKPGNNRVFLATDDPDYLEMMKKTYGNKIVFRDAAREKGNVFFDDNVDKGRKSKDIIMATLVLSQCDELVKSWSAVSEFAVYFNKKFTPRRPYSVIDLQQNPAAKDRTSTCLAIEANKECTKEAPRIASLSAMHDAIKKGACSRECARYRSLQRGVVPAASMFGEKSVIQLIARWKEDIAWTSELPFCYVVMEKEGNGHDAGADPNFVVANKGNEASSFLHFIDQNYDNLPDNLVATHGEQKSEHSVNLVPLLQSVDLDAYGYASLNGIVFPMVDPDDFCDIYSFYANVMVPHNTPEKKLYPDFPRDFTGFSLACCAQFVVSKERILRNPKAAYSSFSAFTVGGKNSGHAHGATVINDETTWHGYSFLEESGTMTHENPPNPVVSPQPPKLKKTPPHCRNRDMAELSSFERGEALELTWHVLFGEEWRATPIDSVKFCGSEKRCPQNMPIIRATSSTSKIAPGVVENPRDPYWYPATEFQKAGNSQDQSIPNQVNRVIATPTYAKQAAAMQDLVFADTLPAAPAASRSTKKAGVCDCQPR